MYEEKILYYDFDKQCMMHKYLTMILHRPILILVVKKKGLHNLTHTYLNGVRLRSSRESCITFMIG